VEMANKLGVDSEIDAYPSTAIGGLRIGVTPLEMASAYSTFANGGTHMEPFLVKKVTEDKDGEVVLLEKHRSIGEEVLGKDEAAVITEALRAVITRGTASYYHDLDAEIGRPAAGKTGTSNEFIDAWFIGFIPQLSTSVWVGYPNERRSMVNINGLDVVNGENYPLDIWSLYMQGAVQKYPTVEQFDTPSSDLNLEVKTDGRTYVKPPPPPPEKTTEEKTTEEKTTEEKTTEEKSSDEKSTEDEPGNEKKKVPGQGDAAAKPDIKRPPGVRQTPSGARRDRQPARQAPARQTSASPSPSSASPASASPAADGG
jgi:penicillin-binding protein 1A